VSYKVSKISAPLYSSVLINFLVEELHNLCSSTNGIGVSKSRRVRWVGACRTSEGIREGKESLKRHRHKSKDGIKMCLREVRPDGMIQ
jgi:hypothetical protein